MNNAPNIAVALWMAMEARDWSVVASLLLPEFRAEWPQSGERFDRERFLRVNRAYPGDWHIRVCNIMVANDRIVTEIEVDIDGRTDRAISFFHVRDEKILSLREFWPDPMPVPEWRQGMALEEE